MDNIIKNSVCFMCHDGAGRYLIAQRSKNCRDEWGRWDAGGGAIEFGERIQDALIREVGEEYCAKPKEIQFLGNRDVFREHNGKPTHWITFDHKVLLDPKEVHVGEPLKCDGLRWVTLNELYAMQDELHSQFPVFLE